MLALSILLGEIMKKLIFLFSILSIFIGCSENNSKGCINHFDCNSGFCNFENSTCEIKECEEWKELQNGECILKAGRCVEDDNCSYNKICNTDTKICIVHPCIEFQNCSENEVCKLSIDDFTAYCECKDGYKYIDDLGCFACFNNEIEEISCGFNSNGKKIRTCIHGEWGNFSNCIDSDICVNDDLRDVENFCGFNLRGKQPQKCVLGQWVDNGNCIDSDICVDDDLRDNENFCGFNLRGKQPQKCVLGQWLDSGNCIDSDICVDDDLRDVENFCGFNLRGEQPQKCVLGQWVDNGNCIDSDICVDGSLDILNDVCGFNLRGEQHKICLSGEWINSGDCIDSDICVDDNLRDIFCGIENSGIGEDICILGHWSSVNCSSWEKIDSNLSNKKMVVDENLNVFVIGEISNSLDDNQYLGGVDFYLIKYDSFGNKLWSKQYGTEFNETVNAVDIDSFGNIYISGITSGVFLESGNYADDDIFFIKVSAEDGSLLMMNQYGTNAKEIGAFIKIDFENNIYITSVSYGQIAGDVNIINTKTDSFITKFNFLGEQLWSRNIGENYNDYITSITSDISGNIYITGSQTGQNGHDVYIISLDGSGNILWKNILSTTSEEKGNSIYIKDNYLYITGYTSGALDGNIKIGRNDIFLAKYSINGVKEWVKQIVTTLDDYGYSILVDNSDSIFLLSNETNNFSKFNQNGEKLWALSLNAKIEIKNIDDAIFILGEKNLYRFNSSIGCNPSCNIWEICYPNNQCIVSPYFCNINSDCEIGRYCDLNEHLCKIGCNLDSMCSYDNYCDLNSFNCKFGCLNDENCLLGKYCNLSETICKPFEYSQFFNGDFSEWENDSKAKYWTGGVKSEDGDSSPSINITTNLKSDKIFLGRNRANSLTFNMKGQGKILIKLCSRTYILNLIGDNTTFTYSNSSNIYNIFNTNGIWQQFTVNIGDEIVWNEGDECFIEFRKGYDYYFNAYIDNVVLNYE